MKRFKINRNYILPAISIVFLTMIFVIPFFTTLTKSFISTQGDSTVIGFENYRRLFSHAFFSQMTCNTIILATAVPITIFISLWIVYYFSNNRNLLHLVRVVSLIPYILPIIVYGFLVSYVFGYKGSANNLMQWLNFEPREWLANHAATMTIIISIIIWASFGQGIFIFSIAIQNLNKRYIQLAEVDGCSRMQIFFKIIVPNIGKYILFFSISLFLWCITGAFPLIQILTNGGPGYMSTTLDYYTYIKAFLSNSDYGVACASAVVQLLIILCFFATVITIRVIGKKYHVAS